MNRQTFLKRFFGWAGAAAVSAKVGESALSREALPNKSVGIGLPMYPYREETTLYHEMMAHFENERQRPIVANKLFWAEYEGKEFKVVDGFIKDRPEINTTYCTIFENKT